MGDRRRNSFLSGSGGPSSGDSIKVICRYRPAKEGEANGLLSSIHASANGVPRRMYRLDEESANVGIEVDEYNNKNFTFDKLFGVESTQSQLFGSVQDVVDSIMAGFNGTVLAYGQTSAGKSWTMEGPSLWDMTAQGIIPRAIDRVFECIAAADVNLQFQVTVSYYEIYCERVRDLLNPTLDNLKLRETKTDGFVVENVTETFCTDRDGIFRLIETGKANRASAPTLMNAESSRSHSILSILLHQRHEVTGRQKRGRLFLVDLAGSEKVSKTGASGLRLEEAKNINSSLTTLGMVINSLCDGSSHIPYRDSKLTRLLMEALGGNSKTALIICCAPELRHLSETVSTLRFGERAKRIQNRAKVNEELSIDELKFLLHNARKEIEALRRAAGVGRSGSPSTLLSDLDDSRSSSLQHVNEGGRGNGGQGSCDDLASIDASADGEATRTVFARMTIEEMEEANRNGQRLTETAARLEQAEDRVRFLSARVAALEEEVDMERAGAENERESKMQLAAEVTALRSTVGELEAKLLKATLEAKGSHTSKHPTKKLDLGAAELDLVGEENGESTLEADGRSGVAPPGGAGTSLGSKNVDEKPATDGPEKGNRKEGEGRSASATATYNLGELSDELRQLLSEEIQSLEANLASRDTETRSAQANAVDYAEKYIRLREDYESHVQRLMMKLTREQQARIYADDRLEEALRRIWLDDQKPKSDQYSASGFFASFFSGATSMSSNKRTDLSSREIGLARSLELANSRCFQLASELEATKEAHEIVLETKESVMRSLVKQNAHLTTERDSLLRRVEDLSQTTLQLTGLLRSVQNRKLSALRASGPNSTTPNTLQGGGGLRPSTTQAENLAGGETSKN